MKTLFVGGPKDGKREVLPPESGMFVQCAVFDPNKPTSPPVFGDCFDFQTHTYQLKRFQDGIVDYQVAFHSTVKNPMEALIKGYHYHRRPRYR